MVWPVVALAAAGIAVSAGGQLGAAGAGYRAAIRNAAELRKTAGESYRRGRINVEQTVGAYKAGAGASGVNVRSATGTPQLYSKFLSTELQRELKFLTDQQFRQADEMERAAKHTKKGAIMGAIGGALKGGASMFKK